MEMKEEYKISDYLKDEPELIELTIKNLREDIKSQEQENARLKETLNAIKECLQDWEKAYMTFGFNEYDEILEKMSNLIKETEQ